MPDVLVLVTGSGRSGTSTLAGTLSHLGVHVPGPFLKENVSNPKGFFESRWSVRFHNGLAERAGIQIGDARPHAFGLAQQAVTAKDRERLSAFLQRSAAGRTQTVVKDPRLVWFSPLWEQAAAGHGLETRYVTMLRHPAEVSASRVTYYSTSAAQDSPEAQRRRRRDAILNVARWVNVSLLNERRTRGRARAFVRYTDLLTQWRPVLLGLGADLGLTYDVDVAAGTPCAVDDFIDGTLRRHEASWDGLDVPTDLRRVAQAVWGELEVLADHHGQDEAASARLDDLAEAYGDLLFVATALDTDERIAAARAAADRAVDQARQEALAGGVEQRPLAAVPARALLAVCARRVVRRAWR